MNMAPRFPADATYCAGVRENNGAELAADTVHAVGAAGHLSIAIK
jgi:hypothetical protein